MQLSTGKQVTLLHKNLLACLPGNKGPLVDGRFCPENPEIPIQTIAPTPSAQDRHCQSIPEHSTQHGNLSISGSHQHAIRVATGTGGMKTLPDTPGYRRGVDPSGGKAECQSLWSLNLL